MIGSPEVIFPAKESHDVEFKTSLSLRHEAAQTIVAFANAHGGDLFFGIKPDSTVVGVDVGDKTLEKLAADLDRLIYPYVPGSISEIALSNGRAVVQISVVADTPPVIGVYLYSSQALDQDGLVSVEHVRAYRRVGRTNRQVPDFMWLRPQLRSDPLMLIDCMGQTPGDPIPKQIGGSAWLADTSGPAHGLRFRLDPELAPSHNADRSLPLPNGGRKVGFNFDITKQITALDGAWVIAEYKDNWGCVWESRRYIEFRGGAASPTASFVYRIVALPPKRGAA